MHEMRAYAIDPKALAAINPVLAAFFSRFFRPGTVAAIGNSQATLTIQKPGTVNKADGSEKR
jgi:hypothetical protein